MGEHAPVAAGMAIRYEPGMIVYHPARRDLRELCAKWDRHIQHELNGRARQGRCGSPRNGGRARHGVGFTGSSIAGRGGLQRQAGGLAPSRLKADGRFSSLCAAIVRGACARCWSRPGGGMEPVFPHFLQDGRLKETERVELRLGHCAILRTGRVHNSRQAQQGSCPKRWCKSGGHGLSSMLARAVAQAAAMRLGLALWIIAQASRVSRLM